MPVFLFVPTMLICKIACDLLEYSFIDVDAVARFLWPRANTYKETNRETKRKYQVYGYKEHPNDRTYKQTIVKQNASTKYMDIKNIQMIEPKFEYQK